MAKKKPASKKPAARKAAAAPRAPSPRSAAVGGFTVGQRVKAIAGDYGNAGGEVKVFHDGQVGVHHDSDTHDPERITYHDASNLVAA